MDNPSNKAKPLPFLGEGDSIITAFAEPAAGPGWSNSPIWVIVRNVNGKLREECIQPEDQSYEMGVLYSTSAAAHQAMKCAVLKANSPANTK